MRVRPGRKAGLERPSRVGSSADTVDMKAAELATMTHDVSTAQTGPGFDPVYSEIVLPSSAR